MAALFMADNDKKGNWLLSPKDITAKEDAMAG